MPQPLDVGERDVAHMLLLQAEAKSSAKYAFSYPSFILFINFRLSSVPWTPPPPKKPINVVLHESYYLVGVQSTKTSCLSHLLTLGKSLWVVQAQSELCIQFQKNQWLWNSSNESHTFHCQYCNRRTLPSSPELILHAPDLYDDYYLNLLDWGESTRCFVSNSLCKQAQEILLLLLLILRCIFGMLIR